MSAGRLLRDALRGERPLQVVGTVNAYHARLAQACGFRAIYLSGGGVAAGSLGVPDLGISTLEDVLVDARRITDACDLPLLVDADTGFGASAFAIARTTRSLIKAGAAGMHLEDQVAAKRCGHRPNKALVDRDEMVDRLKAAVDARGDPHFFIMARTDALASEGADRTLERVLAYVAAGADGIFLEAAGELSVYARFCQAAGVPLLANLTEFGLTPLWTLDELRPTGVALVLYPLSAFRAMNAAALHVYQTIRRNGSQQAAIAAMQTREELYGYLDYYAYEARLDRLFAQRRARSDDQ
jgi:methylisocitrate lyase